jgi:autotransporter-associated beta strand protein
MAWWCAIPDTWSRGNGRQVVSLLAAVCLGPAAAQAQLPAFPGAEGFGAFASGGRSGDVYHVTNLSGNPATPGSLGYGLRWAPATGRTIVFDVSGNIPLPHNSGLYQPNLTIAGQTAPGDGVAIIGGAFWIEKTNVIVRHIGFRNGVNADCLDLSSNAVDVVLDHIDALFGTDENFSSFGSPPDRLTFQWSANAWGLYPHSAGGLWDVNRVTTHHTLWAHHHMRDPKARPNGLLDWVNNVTFDYQIGYIMGSSTTPADWKSNVEGCYFICPAGNIRGHIMTGATLDRHGNPNFSVYMTNCLFDRDGDLVLDGVPATWAEVDGDYRQLSNAVARTAGLPVTTDPPRQAYKKIVSQAGPLRLDARHPGPLRDEVGEALLHSLVTLRHDALTNVAQTGASGGGYGTLRSRPNPLDTDRDGMPDYWETTLGWNPASDDHRAAVPTNAFVPVGYTRLEEYLQFKAMPHAAMDRTTSNESTALDVDLHRYTMGFTNRLPVVYTLSNLSTGSVALVGGHLARFQPPTNFAGRARFDFGATDGDGDTWTQTFAVLVSSVPLPRDLVWKGDGATNNWDTNTLSFVEGSTAEPAAFRQDDAVTFNDDGDEAPPVTLLGSLRPGSITVENETKQYTFAGSGVIGGQASLTKRGGGKLTLRSNLTNSGPIALEGGMIVLGSPTSAVGRLGPGELTISGNAVLSNAWVGARNPIFSALTVPEGETGTVFTSRSLLLTGTLAGAGTLVIVSQSITGDVQLAGLADAFAGTVRFQPGSTNPAVDLMVAYGQFRGFPLAAVELGPSNHLRPFTTASGNTIPLGALTGAAFSVLGGGTGGGGGPATWSIGGLNRDDWFGGAIQSHAKLIKAGTGTLTLAGRSVLTGATTVAAGTLVVNGTLTVSRVALATNTLLAGWGRIGGGLVVSNNATLAPGLDGPGTLTVSNGITLKNTRWLFDLAASPTGTSDRLAMEGGALALSNAQTFVFSLAEGLPAAGTYGLVTGGVSTAAGTASFTHNLPAGTRQSFALATPPGQLVLHVTNDPTTLRWRGTNSSAWNHSATNWLNGVTPDRFWRLDAVRFDDTATNGSVVLAQDVEPRELVVSNASRAYVFSGAGGLTGEVAWVKAGTGTLTVAPYVSIRESATISNSAAVVITNTAGLAAGLGVSGTGIPAGARVASVDSATGLTLTASSTTGGLFDLTFFAAHRHTGGLRVEGGVVALGNSPANLTGLGGGPITLDGGVLQLYGYAGSGGTDYGTFTNDLVVPSAGEFRVPPRASLEGGLSGTGTLDVVTDYVRAEFRGDWSAFAGRLNVRARSGGAEFRLGHAAGLPGAALSLSNGVRLYTTLDNLVLPIGELAGPEGCALGAGNGSATNPTWVVGGRGTDAVFAGAISNAGVTRVVKVGAGRWTLTASNSFSGGMVVSGGVLVVNNGSGSATGPGALRVAVGAGLAGTGTVYGVVTLEEEAELVPGDGGIGTLTISNALNLAADSITRVEIDRAAGTCDVVVCRGRASYGGSLIISNLAGTLAAGDRFRIFDAASRTGTFAQISGPPARQAHWIFDPTNGEVRLVSDFVPGTARYEARIEFTNYPHAGTLTNFPALVRLGNHVPGFDYNSFLTADGSDLRFRRPGDTNLLNHEIDRWDEAGESLVWVQIPAFSNGCAVIASWGDAGATNPPAHTTNGATWTEGYVGVWHVRGTNLSDATARGHDAFTNSAAAGGGITADGLAFDGVAQQARAAVHADFNLRSNFAVQCWFKVPAAYKPSVGNYRTLTAKELPADFNNRNWWLGIRSEGWLQWKSSPGVDITNRIDLCDGQWHHVAAIHAGAAGRLYVDGVERVVDPTPGTISTQAAPVVFGAEDGTARYFKGTLDEWRVSSVPRSSNWVWAVYHTVADGIGFATYGAAAVTNIPLPPSQFRSEIAFPGYDRPETLTDIPLLVVLGTNVPGFDYSQFRGAAGADLRFTDEANVHILDHEVDVWNTAGLSRVWVKVPALSNGCRIAATWGHPGYQAPPCTTNGGVWSNDYLGVWHLRETAGPHRDSSPAFATSRFVSVAAQGVATGIVGGCDHFVAASSHHVSLPHMGTNAAVTVEGWFYLTAPPGGNDIGLISSDPWTAGVTHFKINSAYQLKGEVNGGGFITSPTNQVSMSNWFHAAYTVAGAGGTDFRIYGNGGLIGAAGGRTNNDLSDVNIAREFNGRYLNARVDEVRISRVARSSNWLWAVHRNLASNGAFVAYGVVSNQYPNTAPLLAGVSDRAASAGVWLVLTNAASDADVPAQALVFTLVQGPDFATLGPTNGIFAWRPAVAQAAATHTVRVAVTDSGWPALGATQSFRVSVAPVGTAAVAAVSATNGQFAFRVAGDSGLDYVLEATTDLSQWLPVSASNGATPPLSITVPVDTQAVRRMYRLRLGP